MEIEELLDEIDTARRTSRCVWDISNQRLSSLPSSFFTLSSLSVLHMHNNSFVSLPSDIAMLTQLCVLDLSSNQLKHLPTQMIQLTQLTSLFLHANNLCEIPDGFSGLTGLRVLSLGCNQFKGAVPNDVFALENLTSFSCCANKLSEFPLDIVKLSRLTSLNLSMNIISSIPEGAVLPLSLTCLNLSTNYLSSLPTNFLSNLSSLKTLNLSYNTLTSFPTDILQLTNLNSLQLDNNQLTELPAQISSMTQLTTLTLEGNPLPSYILELHRTLKTGHFLFRVGLGAAHSLAHHVHDVVAQQRALTRLYSASNDRVDPRKVVVHNKEMDELAKLTNLKSNDLEAFFDEEEGTSMSREGFQRVVAKAGYTIAADPILMDSAFSLFDMNGNGTVDVKELLLGFTVLEHGSLMQKLKFGFHLYDINHDNSIEKNELKVMLMKIGAMKGYPKRTAVTTTTKIDEFITNVYKEKEILTYEDFVEAALSDHYISDLFSLDQFFQKNAPRSSFPSPNSMRKADSTAYKDPRKLLIKKRETRELAKLTHMNSSELLTIFDLQHTGEDDTDSMSREKFREIMANTGLVISKDSVLLDCLFDVFDLDLSGTVERKELLVGLITLHSGALTQKLKLGFHLYDANGDGSIERHELRGMLMKIAALQPNRSTTLLSTEIDDFVGRVFAGRRLLLFDDFIVAAQSDSHIAQLFALESIFRTIQK